MVKMFIFPEALKLSAMQQQISDLRRLAEYSREGMLTCEEQYRQRSVDAHINHAKALEHLKAACYALWFEGLPTEGKDRNLEDFWAEKAKGLEIEGAYDVVYVDGKIINQNEINNNKED